jgi:hypothetical protein
MSVVIQAAAYADGRPCPVAGLFLKAFDFDALDGRGQGVWTPSRAHALHFPDTGDALDFWCTESRVVPLRDDGEANRPLTALSILVSRGCDG